MLKIDIPGETSLQLKHLVFDYNGTLARDGQLLDGVAERLAALAKNFALHVITGDTFGTARDALAGLPLAVKILPPLHQRAAKLDYVRSIGADLTVAIGNGNNDRDMLAAVALGIVVFGAEGVAGPALASARVVAPDILTALDLLANPRRLVATLRS